MDNIGETKILVKIHVIYMYIQNYLQVTFLGR